MTLTLEGIAVREKKRAPMQSLNSTWATRAKGIGSDFRGSPSRRQVTALSADSWQATTQQLGQSLSWLSRRANLLINGHIFTHQDIGKLIIIGHATFEITGECDPCYRMDEQASGLQSLLSQPFYGGVCCRVLNDGLIMVGDEVKVIDVKQWDFAL